MLVQQAELAASGTSGGKQRVQALTSVAKAAAAAGDHDRADTLLQQAEHAARSATGPDEQAHAWAWELTNLASAAVAAGGRTRAAALVRQAAAVISSLTDPAAKTGVLGALAKVAASSGDFAYAGTLANSGDYERAESVARVIPAPVRQLDALCIVANAMINAGDIKRAETLADNLPSPGLYPYVVAALAAKADPARALALVARALTIWRWPALLEALALTSPPALATIADNYLEEHFVRWRCGARPPGGLGATARDPPFGALRGRSL